MPVSTKILIEFRSWVAGTVVSTSERDNKKTTTLESKTRKISRLAALMSENNSCLKVFTAISRSTLTCQVEMIVTST